MNAASPPSPARTVAILGARGRMGLALIEALPAHPGLSLGLAVQRGSAAGAELRPGVPLLPALQATAFEVLVDFTRPEATLQALEFCERHAKAIVIGTTGFAAEQKQRIEQAAGRIPVCFSGNYSIGINLCLALVEQAARVLGARFDIELVEAHHRHKVDAPSGTALMLGEAAARGVGLSFAEHAVYERHGHTGARPAQAIGFSAVRGGDVVGEHSVLFLGDGERVEIAHRASSRLNFAHGALRAALWLAGRPPGLYSMRDVLSDERVD